MELYLNAMSVSEAGSSPVERALESLTQDSGLLGRLYACCLRQPIEHRGIDHRALTLKITKSKFHLGTLRCGKPEDTTGVISFVQPSKKNTTYRSRS
jgi:hypothetical protein